MTGGYAERLAAANGSLRFTDIRGKQYAEVNQRILAFWSLFPEGRIVTEKTMDDGQRCEFRCLAYRDGSDERPAATGHAFEVRRGTVNATSYVENCETSAVGRALGLMGIGATTALASADEVLGAIAQQEHDAPKDDGRGRSFARIAQLKSRAIANGVSEDGMNAWYAAKFGKVGMNRLDAGQLKELEEYMETMERDSETLAREGE